MEKYLTFVAILSIAVILGCKPRVSRTSLSGSVSLDGIPVQDGQIAFEPTDSGKMEFAIVTDGHYMLPEEYGLLPGEYIVRITGNQATGKQAQADSFLNEADDVSLEIFEQYIPAKFNTASDLRIHIEPVEQLEADFDLSSN